MIISPGFSSTPGVEAAVLTLLRAGPKTFLGGVELVGSLDERCTLAWFAGKSLGEVATECGVSAGVDAGVNLPTLCVGAGSATTDGFWLGLTVTADGFVLTPDEPKPSSADGSVEAGVAAAGAALNQAFQHIYRKAPQAGQREVTFRFPVSSRLAPPRDLWIVGLRHLGQAYLWTTMLKGGETRPALIRLTDDDNVSSSSLSTCLLVDAADVGRKKVNAVATRLVELGVKVEQDLARLDMDFGPVTSAQPLCVVAVDNLALRRSLDKVRGANVLEAGIGDGVDGFARVQAHAFPGRRRARDIWVGEDPKASRAVDISKPAYQSLLKECGDECGTTILAGHPSQRHSSAPLPERFSHAFPPRASFRNTRGTSTSTRSRPKGRFRVATCNQSLYMNSSNRCKVAMRCPKV